MKQIASDEKEAYDLFAAYALQALVAGNASAAEGDKRMHREWAQTAFAIARAMLEERKQARFP